MNADNNSMQLEKTVANAEDFLPLLGTDYVELYVGNAKQAAYYYISAWELCYIKTFLAVVSFNK